jgi:hypothetical protein
MSFANAPSANDIARASRFLRPDPPPKLRLLDGVPINRGALIGKARIRVSPGIEISDVAVFEKDGRRWAQFPSEVMRDRDGQPLTDGNGKARYQSQLRWESRQLQERFSACLVELVL